MPLLYIYLLYFFILSLSLFFFFFFNDTATTEIYTLSLHDALPIYKRPGENHHVRAGLGEQEPVDDRVGQQRRNGDRKSTRLNSSHVEISYAVFCLKKKKKKKKNMNKKKKITTKKK